MISRSRQPARFALLCLCFLPSGLRIYGGDTKPETDPADSRGEEDDMQTHVISILLVLLGVLV
jgi:hypothetical protein